MTEPIEEAYFNWLCSKVLNGRTKNYLGLLQILHQTEFTWLMVEDGNRAIEGVDVREEFLLQTGVTPDPDWEHVGCSIFEMLLGLANRISFLTDVPPKKWFWEFIENLDLGEYRRVSLDQESEIDDILYRLVWRTYNDAGHGGLFPLRWPKRDQRKVEIWYQFSDYFEERGES